MGIVSLRLGVIAFVLVAGAAEAADCQLQLIGGAELTYEEHGRPLVPVTIEGHARTMLLDSGGGATMLNRETAEELGLRESDAGVIVTDIAGRRSQRLVHADEFRVGNMNAGYHRFMIDPGGIASEGWQGLLSLDFFRQYDIELDFGSNLFLVFSQDHCEGMVVHWGAPSAAVVQFELTASDHITFPVMLDGHEIIAVLDTGAAYTVLDLVRAIELYGVRIMLNGEPVGEPLDLENPEAIANITLEASNAETGETADAGLTFVRQPESLTFEGISIPNPELKPVPLVNVRPEQPRFGRGPQYPEIIIGMDLLRHLHVYVAMGERRLYITGASAPPSGEPATAAEEVVAE